MAGMRNKTRTNYLFNSLYQITTIIIPLITMPYLSRILGAEGLGKYSFAYSVAFYFCIFVKLGLQNYGNRTIAYVKDNAQDLSNAFWGIYTMQFILGIIVILVYYLYAIVLSPNKEMAMIMSIVVFSSIIDVTWFMYGMEEFKVTAIRDIVTKIITTTCIFAIVKDAEDYWKYALIFSIGLLVNQIVVWPVVFKYVVFKKVTYDDVRPHIAPNLVLFLPVVAVSIYRTMDKIMLGSMAGEVELGYYHSCENVISVPLALINSLGIIMLPRMSNMIALGISENDISSVFNKSIRFAVFVASSIGFGIMTVSKEFVPFFYGKGFEKCIILFYVILPGCVFQAFANVIRTQYLIPRKHDRIYILSLALGAIVNVAANLLLIPKLLSVGAAIGTTAAEIVVCVVQAAFVYKSADIGHNVASSLPFLLSGIVMFVLFKEFDLQIDSLVVKLILKILICGCIYIVVTALFIGIRILIKKAATFKC